MAKKCPAGFICADTSTMVFGILVLVALSAGIMWVSGSGTAAPEPKVIVVQSPSPSVASLPPTNQQFVRPDLYPEPVRRGGYGIPALATRGPAAGPVQQVGILTAEGGSSTSAAPDRTILPLFGREMDARRGKWNYYTRTDGTNPVQVPVRYGKRLCDDDTNGCDEISNDDSIHVPALGRSFTATVYRKSLFD
jgi:hypothetical protein